MMPTLSRKTRITNALAGPYILIWHEGGSWLTIRSTSYAHTLCLSVHFVSDDVALCYKHRGPFSLINKLLAKEGLYIDVYDGDLSASVIREL